MPASVSLKFLATITLSLPMVCVAAQPSWGDRPLNVVYPPQQHQTTAAQIFFIGTASPNLPVLLNGHMIEQRSPAGHFSPSIPLQWGENQITLQAGEQTLTFQIHRQVLEADGLTTAAGFRILEPTANLARQPGEPLCFTALGKAGDRLQVQVGPKTVDLSAIDGSGILAPNTAALIDQTTVYTSASQTYRGCTDLPTPGAYGPIRWHSRQGSSDQTIEPGTTLDILNPAQLPRITVIRPEGGIARTGPGTDYSRLTPLPTGTRAQVTGRTGDWLRLDYGGWIRASETQSLPVATPTQARIRSIIARPQSGWTDITFPLELPVPVTVAQGDRHFTLTLHNTTAQTDVIRLDPDPVIQRLDWAQVSPSQVQYRFQLHSGQQWGYRLRYEGNQLILSLRHPPQRRGNQPLSGIKILLDPGHGGPEDLGARGPDGTPEKEITLMLSQHLARDLEQLGATVILTRQDDRDVDLPERVALIEATEPTLALSIHYNALPDAGDAWNTQGIGTFWYESQSHSLAIFLEEYLSRRLDRPRYGVFWNNLALTRPTVAPAVLLELGFMINPEEFEWITDTQAQAALSRTLAQGIQEWLDTVLVSHP